MDEAFVNSDALLAAEEMLRAYQAEHGSVDASWRALFEQLGADGAPQPHLPVDGLFRSARPMALGAAKAPSPKSASRASAGAGGASVEALGKQERVDQLIRAFRCRGHHIAQLDPLKQHERHDEELTLAFYGLADADLDVTFSARSFSPTPLKLCDIVAHLHKTYCGSIGVQYMHIDDQQVRSFLQERMESSENYAALSKDEQLRILSKLTDAEVFEQFLHRKFLGARRFSLEGAESLIPMLDSAIEEAARAGTREVVIGMAHRGRINVLANIIKKNVRKIFQEFQDTDPYLKPGRGDVKYHLGYSGDYKSSQGHDVHLSLCFNPSHLGFVTPVAQGRVRAKQDRRGDGARTEVLTIAIHGDAAFSGQGTTQEVLNMSQLPGYTVGGTLHILVNNQVGFTTPPELGRSTPYATDVARMLEVPIFHVNGEDPQSVTQVVRLAMEFRARFRRDVVVDMYCYRKLGHNESDEPAFTQPEMYRAIASQRSVREQYTQNLIALGDIDEAQAKDIVQLSIGRLEDELSAIQRGEKPVIHEDRGVWEAAVTARKEGAPPFETKRDATRLRELLLKVSRAPAEFTPHPKLVKLLEQRSEMARGERALDWGGGEALAFASLLDEGRGVRISGQDSGRGTFSHRHAVLHDANTGTLHTPLAHIKADQGRLEIIDSPLSESGVLGFDYGYSLDAPEGLVVWEAQFGDFANGAQVIIDQFIASGEAKWQRLSGLTLLLPHGYEGAGSEHSSARIERFLALAAENNLQVCNPTTPAQLFHLLRRQVVRALRTPLIVMTPKSLLRHPMATSPIDDCANGAFCEVLPEMDEAQRKGAKRVLLCSGKVYYDLVQARADKKLTAIPILRIEQLYPHTEDSLTAALAPYGKKVRAVWVQEEPDNSGAWPYLRYAFGERIGTIPLEVVAREASAAPAVGSASRHKLEQEALLTQALG